MVVKGAGGEVGCGGDVLRGGLEISLVDEQLDRRINELLACGCGARLDSDDRTPSLATGEFRTAPSLTAN